MGILAELGTDFVSLWQPVVLATLVAVGSFFSWRASANASQAKKQASEINAAVNHKEEGEPTLREMVVEMRENQNLMKHNQDVVQDNQRDFRAMVNEIRRDQQKVLSAIARHEELLLNIENHMTANETRLRHVLRSWATFETDADGNCVWVSRKWSEITGVPLIDALGSGWVSAIHPDDLFLVTDEWGRAVNDGTDFGPITYRFIHAHTHRVTVVQGEAAPVRDSTDHLIGWIGSIEPVNIEVGDRHHHIEPS